MDNIKKHLPLLSILLIFIGYCHLHFYYTTQFNIDIYYYITSGEIILSFLPIIFKLFLLTLFIGIVIICTKAVQIKRKNIGFGHSASVYKRLYHRKNVTKKKKRILLLYICFPIELTVFLIVSVYTYLLIKSELFDWIYARVFISLMWLFWIFIIIRKRINAYVRIYFPNNHQDIYRISLIVLTFLYTDYIQLSKKANDVKNGLNETEIEFIYDKKKIDSATDTMISYIGSTQQYIFIYNRIIGDNFIYDKSKVINLVFKERNKTLFGQRFAPFKNIHVNKDSVKKVVFEICDSLKNKSFHNNNLTVQKIVCFCDSLKILDSLKKW